MKTYLSEKSWQTAELNVRVETQDDQITEVREKQTTMNKKEIQRDFEISTVEGERIVSPVYFTSKSSLR